MIRKLLSVMMAVLLVCSFTGCRSKTTTTTNKNDTSSTVSGSKNSASPSASASPEASALPDSSVTPEEGNTPEEENLGSLGPFREALRGVYGEKYYPDTRMTDEEIRSELGMDETLYEEVYAERSAQSAYPDTFIAVKVKEGKTEEVKEKLNAYKQRMLQNNDFAAHQEKINAAEVYAEGDYVFFVLLGDVQDSTSSEGIGEAFGNEIQRGIDAIKEAIGTL